MKITNAAVFAIALNAGLGTTTVALLLITWLILHVLAPFSHIIVLILHQRHGIRPPYQREGAKVESGGFCMW